MILFLDFDVILHARSEGRFCRADHFERVMREFLDVDIVISSSWRETFPLDAMRGFLSGDIAARIIGAIPVIRNKEPPYQAHVRELEIEQWLAANGREKESWVALDDMPILFRDGSSHLIFVDPARGFDEGTEFTLRKRLAQRIAPKQVLLLDLDGVLHPDAAYINKKGPYLKGEGSLFMWSPILSEVLLGFPDVRIVLSTSWVRVRGFSRTKRHLSPDLAARVIGSTYHSYMRGTSFADMTRYQQIAAHVQRTGIDHWIALDDDDEGWPASMAHHLVCTDGNAGLSDPAIVQELQEKLENLGKTVLKK